MKPLFVIAACLLMTVTTLAASKKNVEALRISTPLTIDAVLDEAVYSQVSPAEDFSPPCNPPRLGSFTMKMPFM